MEALEMGGDCTSSTTFVHADTSTFRDLVQRLTGRRGPDQTQPQHAKSNAATSISSRKTTSRLHERRQYMRPKLDIVKPTITSSHFKSSSPLVIPSTIFSKLSIAKRENSLLSPAAAANSTVRTYEHEDEKNRNSQSEEETQERGIEERRAYLCQSPRRGKLPRSPPELLPLFPLTSPESNLHSP